MGTQQLLLIVLGVIIVGIAIAVGIAIFNNQSYNSNQQAVAQQANTYATQVIQWWKTPVTQGGAGQDTLSGTSKADITTWLGFPASGAASTDNGKYIVSSAADGTTSVVLKSCGTEKRGGVYALVTTTIDLTASSVTSVIEAAGDADGVPQ
jgi:hypothetical protein